MSARDVICNAASDCPSVVIRGDVYELTDEILAALSAAGYVTHRARAAIAALADAVALKRLIEDVHGAGYHDALTGVDPMQSQSDTVEAALKRFRAALPEQGGE